MRTVTKLLLALALALTLSAPARALVKIDLVQVGGTYRSWNGIQPGDTLVLNITYSIDPGDYITGLAAGIVFDGSVQSFNAAGSTETGVALWSGGSYALNNLAVGDIGLNPLDPYQALGWEKASTVSGGGTAPCAFGACTSLGTAAFVLTGGYGVIAVGNVGLEGGTAVGDSTFMDIAGNPALVSLG